MKRKAALLLSAVMAVAAIGCGSGDTKEQVPGTEAEEGGAAAEYESPSFDLIASDYVTLCDYPNMEVSIEGDYTVNEDEVKEYFSQMFSYYGPYYVKDETKTTVGEGDIVNVDYVGKLDGVAFDGGTAENQNIDVYNNSSAGGGSGYIDGFTDGLKGASVGDVIDWDVTFPENYGSEDLAGKAVVFTFTVNSIQKEITEEEVDDAFVKEQYDVESLDAMYDQLRSYLELSAENTKLSDTYTAIQSYLLENCTVDIPEDYLAARVNDYQTQFVQENLSGDESQLEDYLSTNYGKTLEESRGEWESGMKENISLELIMETIAEKENITLDEEGYSGYIQNLVSGNGYESEEELYKNYGYDDAAYGEAYLRQIYVDNLALEKLKDTVKINETNTDGETEEETEK